MALRRDAWKQQKQYTAPNILDSRVACFLAFRACIVSVHSAVCDSVPGQTCLQDSVQALCTFKALLHCPQGAPRWRPATAVLTVTGMRRRKRRMGRRWTSLWDRVRRSNALFIQTGMSVLRQLAESSVSRPTQPDSSQICPKDYSHASLPVHLSQLCSLAPNSLRLSLFCVPRSRPHMPVFTTRPENTLEATNGYAQYCGIRATPVHRAVQTYKNSYFVGNLAGTLAEKGTYKWGLRLVRCRAACPALPVQLWCQDAQPCQFSQHNMVSPVLFSTHMVHARCALVHQRATHWSHTPACCHARSN